MRAFYFRDRSGRRFKIVSEIGLLTWSFHIETKGFPALGYANCNPRPNGEVLLGDINLHQAVKPLPFPWPISAILGRRPRSFRGKGLGTAFLSRVVWTARSLGYKRMVGRIFSRDLGERPWLPAWYAKTGFAVVPDEDGYLIEMEL